MIASALINMHHFKHQTATRRNRIIAHTRKVLIRWRRDNSCCTFDKRLALAVLSVLQRLAILPRVTSPLNGDSRA